MVTGWKLSKNRKYLIMTCAIELETIANLVLKNSSGTTPLLTKRENDVMPLLATGVTGKEMADRLGISLRTVKFHASEVYRKMGVSGRRELMALLNFENMETGEGKCDTQN